jgi:hypothetical protein
MAIWAHRARTIEPPATKATSYQRASAFCEGRMISATVNPVIIFVHLAGEFTPCLTSRRLALHRHIQASVAQVHLWFRRADNARADYTGALRAGQTSGFTIWRIPGCSGRMGRNPGRSCATNTALTGGRTDGRNMTRRGKQRNGPPVTGFIAAVRSAPEPAPAGCGPDDLSGKGKK